MAIIHASCVAVNGAAILLRGPSGSGKSDLALRLIDDGALLVADDQVVLEPGDGNVLATAPATLHGRMEVRGIGIVEMAPAAGVRVALVADMRPPERIERLPQPETCLYEGVTLPLVGIDPFASSATAKLRLALARAMRDRVTR